MVQRCDPGLPHNSDEAGIVSQPLTVDEIRNYIGEYAVLTSIDEQHLTNQVNKAISEGWTPFGGVSVSLSESDDYRYVLYAQAIVLYVKQPVSD